MTSLLLATCMANYLEVQGNLSEPSKDVEPGQERQNIPVFVLCCKWEL